jgi:hypothetical protein
MINETQAAKIGTGLLVLAVAGAAGYGSYDHQVALATANGWQGLAADLFPVMPDGAMVIGSVALLLPKITRNTRAWSRLFAANGFTVTMYANVLSGIAYGLDGMILAAVPAVILFLASEVLFRIIRDLTRKTGQRPQPGIVARLIAWNRKRVQAKARRTRDAAKRLQVARTKTQQTYAYDTHPSTATRVAAN